MNAARFDHFSRMLGRRLSRRSALRRGGSAASAAALVAVGFRHAGAQDATPAPGGDEGGIAFLFVQVASDATWTAKPDTEGVYTLTLTHQAGQTIYFSDRPERVTGAVSTRAFIVGWGVSFPPDDPPNAAIVAGTHILVVEITNPVYDPATATLTYDAILIDPGTASSGIQHLANQQTAQDLPSDLGSISLFIDSAQGHCYPWTECVFGSLDDLGSDYQCSKPDPSWDSWDCIAGPIPDDVRCGAVGYSAYDTMVGFCNDTYSICSEYGPCSPK